MAPLSYNPRGARTNRHQMTLNGKRDLFEQDDLVAFGRFCDLKTKAIRTIVGQMHETLASWPSYAERAGVPEPMAGAIGKTMRTGMSV